MKTLPELNSGLTDEGLSAEPMSELNSDAINKENADWQSAEDEEGRSITDGSEEP